jgi:predicted adenylyl cyclase CyaB
VATPGDASVLQPSRFELKVRDSDPGRSLAICALLGAESGGELRQRDTYFQGDRGRLRLRQEEGGGACLFADERLAFAGAQPRRWKFDIAQPEVVLEAFAGSLGVETVVVKQRRLFLWEGVGIHLDDVQGLGCFIELQSTAADEDGLRCDRAKASALREAFEIEDDDLITESYADLLLAEAGPMRPSVEENRRRH